MTVTFVFSRHASISDDEAHWLLGKLRRRAIKGDRAADRALTEIGPGLWETEGRRPAVSVSSRGREAVLGVLAQAHLDKEMTEDLRFLETELQRARQEED